MTMSDTGAFLKSEQEFLFWEMRKTPVRVPTTADQQNSMIFPCFVQVFKVVFQVEFLFFVGFVCTLFLKQIK